MPGRLGDRSDGDLSGATATATTSGTGARAGLLAGGKKEGLPSVSGSLSRVQFSTGDGSADRLQPRKQQAHHPDRERAGDPELNETRDFEVAHAGQAAKYLITATLHYRKIDQFLLNYVLGESAGITAPVVDIARVSTTVTVQQKQRSSNQSPSASHHPAR